MLEQQWIFLQLCLKSAMYSYHGTQLEQKFVQFKLPNFTFAKVRCSFVFSRGCSSDIASEWRGRGVPRHNTAQQRIEGAGRGGREEEVEDYQKDIRTMSVFPIRMERKQKAASVWEISSPSLFSSSLLPSESISCILPLLFFSFVELKAKSVYHFP